MGSTWVLVCSTALVLVFPSSASEDEPYMEQREVTFDIHQFLQKLQQPDSPMLQREIDFPDLFPQTFSKDNSESPIEQVMVTVFPPEYHPREQGQPSFKPRSHDGPPILNYPVAFPPGRPTSDNLQNICIYGERRPQYPKSYFPASGFGGQVMRASAVNNAESWLSTCCSMNQTWSREVILCCTTQAWEQSVEMFCEEDTSVKHRIYHCCTRQGSDRLKCFSEDAPNPNYEPTEELPVPQLPSTTEFNFDQNTCQRKQITPYRARASRAPRVKTPSTPPKTDISFPPGRPTADTIDSLCRNQRLRPLYNIKCLPSSGYEMVARQAKAINRIEKGFKQCCNNKKDRLNCAEKKWREELKKFCLLGNGKRVDFSCCSGKMQELYICFQLMSPDTHYNMTTGAEELSLNNICDTHKIIKQRFPLGFPLKTFVTQCCPLSGQEKTACSMRLLQEMPQKLCASKKPSSAVRRCCRLPSDGIQQCISNILMDAVTKATKFLSQKKKKRCPIS